MKFCIQNSVNRFLSDEQGVTMIEYGLLAATLAVITIAAGDAITNAITNKVEELTANVATNVEAAIVN